MIKLRTQNPLRRLIVGRQPSSHEKNSSVEAELLAYQYVQKNGETSKVTL